MELVGSGLGKDFNAPLARLVELRGERILVDSDFAYGLLGRQASAGEAIDENLSAVGTGSGTGKGLQVHSQIVAVIGKRFEFRLLQHQRAALFEGSTSTLALSLMVTCSVVVASTSGITRVCVLPTMIS